MWVIKFRSYWTNLLLRHLAITLRWSPKAIICRKKSFCENLRGYEHNGTERSASLENTWLDVYVVKTKAEQMKLCKLNVLAFLPIRDKRIVNVEINILCYCKKISRLLLWALGLMGWLHVIQASMKSSKDVKIIAAWNFSFSTPKAMDDREIFDILCIISASRQRDRLASAVPCDLF